MSDSEECTTRIQENSFSSCDISTHHNPMTYAPYSPRNSARIHRIWCYKLGDSDRHLLEKI